MKFILGKKEEAVRLCEQSVEKHPLSEDALANGERVKWLAYAYIYAGDHERALQSFAKLVQIPRGNIMGRSTTSQSSTSSARTHASTKS
ncbi:MAG: hypothetical protein DME42_11065 [Verrucomicrobia bacterium]|nr:MAG: hypothetical protein DME42_11065 [Verrucomicrobiota bacterium]